MQKLTQEQCIILTGFTGRMLCENFSDFHADVEQRLGRPVWTHQFANEETRMEIEDAYREDFLKLLPFETDQYVNKGN